MLRPTILHLSIAAMILTSGPTSAADALSGAWVLNVSRSHYGGGAEQRRQETFECKSLNQRIKCTIRSIRADGRTLTGRFTAAYDQRSYPTTGIPDVDEVRLSRVDDSVADATFTLHGAPVLGYRAIKSGDGRSLTIISVDPVTRRVLNSVVVYDLRR